MEANGTVGSQLKDDVHQHKVAVEVNADAVARKVAEEEVQPQKLLKKMEPDFVLRGQRISINQQKKHFG